MLLLGVLVVLFGGGVSAQWLNYPTPGIPRTADGKPKMDAPAPRAADGRPDLNGVWVAECDGSQDCFSRNRFFDLARGLPDGAVVMTPWAEAIQKQRESRDHVDDPLGYCRPAGVPRGMFATPFRIIVTPLLTAIHQETTTGNYFREVFTDGRPFPASMEPTWLGYSIGHWEGDDFVVETTGFRDNGWLDTRKARPHSDALRVVERYRRLDFGHATVAITIDDPKAFLKPWTVTTALTLLPDYSLLEGFCDNHEKTMDHRRIDPPPPEPPSPPLAPSVRRE
jgi:hypothetical protein